MFSNKFKSIVLLIVISFISIPLYTGYANSIQGNIVRSYGDYEFVISDDNTAKIIKYTGTSSKITVPQELDSFAVGAIGKKAFYQNNNIEAIILPDSITKIGDFSFYDCNNLRSVSLPSGLKEIGESAFSSCERIFTMMIPDGLEHIGVSAFSICNNLTTLSLPQSVKFIGDNAFYKCDRLLVTVEPDSYAENYCKKNKIKHTYLGSGL